MHIILRLLPLVALMGLAGCGSTVQTRNISQGPVVTAAPVMDPALMQPTPAQTTATAMAMTGVDGFIDPAAAALMSQNSRNQASGAQYNALQFGRPGAPRDWQGEKGVSGKVTVGPYVRVNTIDCRDFTHVVTVAGQSYTRKGTACREVDGRWSVAESSAG